MGSEYDYQRPEHERPKRRKTIDYDEEDKNTRSDLTNSDYSSRVQLPDKSPAGLYRRALNIKNACENGNIPVPSEVIRILEMGDPGLQEAEQQPEPGPLPGHNNPGPPPGWEAEDKAPETTLAKEETNHSAPQLNPAQSSENWRTMVLPEILKQLGSDYVLENIRAQFAAVNPSLKPVSLDNYIKHSLIKGWRKGDDIPDISQARESGEHEGITVVEAMTFEAAFAYARNTLKLQKFYWRYTISGNILSHSPYGTNLSSGEAYQNYQLNKDRGQEEFYKDLDNLLKLSGDKSNYDKIKRIRAFNDQLLSQELVQLVAGAQGKLEVNTKAAGLLDAATRGQIAQKLQQEELQQELSGTSHQLNKNKGEAARKHLEGRQQLIRYYYAYKKSEKEYDKYKYARYQELKLAEYSAEKQNNLEQLTESMRKNGFSSIGEVEAYISSYKKLLKREPTRLPKKH